MFGSVQTECSFRSSSDLASPPVRHTANCILRVSDQRSYGVQLEANWGCCEYGDQMLSVLRRRRADVQSVGTKTRNVCSCNSNQQRVFCVSVTIQPAVCHHYHHETARPTIQRHSRPDRMQLSVHPSLHHCSVPSTKQQTQPSAHRQTSHRSFKRQYINESERCCPNGDVNIAAEFKVCKSVHHQTFN